MSYTFRVVHSNSPLRAAAGTLKAKSRLAAILELFEVYPQCVAIFVKGGK